MPAALDSGPTLIVMLDEAIYYSRMALGIYEFLRAAPSRIPKLSSGTNWGTGKRSSWTPSGR